MSFIPVGPGIPDSGVVSDGASVGTGIAVGIGVSVGAGTLVGSGTLVGVGTSTGAAVGTGMDADVGAWAAAVGDGLFSGPEQAKRVVREMKIAKYSSFDMAVVLLLRLGSFPSVG